MTKKTLVFHMGAMILYEVENFKAGSGCSLSPNSVPNLGTTLSGASSPIRPVSNQMHFRNRTLRTSG